MIAVFIGLLNGKIKSYNYDIAVKEQLKLTCIYKQKDGMIGDGRKFCVKVNKRLPFGREFK